MPRGGAREGAGRPQTDKKRLVVHVTDEERQKLLEVLEKSRREESMIKKYGQTFFGKLYTLTGEADHTNRVLPNCQDNFNDVSDGESYSFEMSAPCIDAMGVNHTAFWIFEASKNEENELDSYDYSICDRVIPC